MPYSPSGGRHELGQNFLTHRPTVSRIVAVVGSTRGTVLEIGAGDGALTHPLARLGRPFSAIDIDPHRVRRLRRALPHTRISHADAMRHPLRADVIVGNIPFHLTTPLFRRLLSAGEWRTCVLLTQWEVARKRAGVGGRTMMAAQAAPWFEFSLLGRVPSWAFSPRPSVDGGLLRIDRRPEPLVPHRQRAAYDRFVRTLFTGRGGTLDRLLGGATGIARSRAAQVLRRVRIDPRALPRDLSPEQLASVWLECSGG